MKNPALTLLLPFIIYCQSIDPIYITLNGDITNPDQEISGLTWHDDALILLPQYPNDKIFSIPKNEILEFIDSSRSTILPNEIKWISSKFDKRICGFEGFESIIFDGDTIYTTIEVEKRKNNYGYLVRGYYDKNNNQITIDKRSKKKINTPVFLRNMTFETLLMSNKKLIAIYEVNSKTVNSSPVYFELDKQLNNIEEKPFPTVEYRITDATDIDQNGKFWATNYFWPGDYKVLKLESQRIQKKDILPVERLLEFQISENKIIRTNNPPINLKLSEFGDSRNWEGIVRLDDKGFLIVTDKFPGTVLAFVPYPN